MSVAAGLAAEGGSTRPALDRRSGRGSRWLFIVLLVIGVGCSVAGLVSDVSGAGSQALAWAPFVLLALALLIALGFEFVNGFHDTANAVATVIYTHALPPNVAVVWSGVFNFLGVLASSGAVAYGILSLLPVELILSVGYGAGFAMVFALLVSAIVWNLGTWWLGLPASSSHTLIGSIIGVGVANALLHGDAGSGVDWTQAAKVGWSLLLSPLVGFGGAALLLVLTRRLLRRPELYAEPRGCTPPPWWIRGLLILTCTGVSFAHGSNDGQKGMGLIMLILVGTLPTAYALNRAMPAEQTARFVALTQTVQATLPPSDAGLDEVRATLTAYLDSRRFEPAVVPALGRLAGRIGEQVGEHGTLDRVPAAAVSNVRNDMYLAAETIRLLERQHAGALEATQREQLHSLRGHLDEATKFIPLWVKVAVAIALGLGTMVGWRRIVVTVGERIGRTHLSYAQGAAAELVAMSTIAAADLYGLPVSTTHVLSSGVAGTMAASGSGVQRATVRNLLLAWVLTLPCAIVLSGSLYWLLRACL
ncbi:inorganic phosphate transporter [Plasticicumulans acidivorans]|uniref:Phosphate transporter n=1 Tax=Plasticicumulans acidivorans TaxID=886464 RepID=A0A317MXW7_9GAMM|nr:inorganic phosphate transporter [Plasticicumulans acidivorans]PWV60157.1 PiT family inorganic phosphate transporter [Plasticicumulans acidivorans]